ncbi:MAG: alpha/beta hydrolase [Bacteroidia bacterium]|nr:alpha/beta hydrolase [Bacteroidia bacterium]
MIPIEDRIAYQEIDYAEHRSLKLNGVDYVYLQTGEGDVIILLHGFPDNAYSWEHQIKYFSQHGYTVIAPFLRGYAPTLAPEQAYFDRATIAKDIVDLIVHVSPHKKVYLVGQDWGAAISYGILGAFPEKIARAVILAIPHQVEIRRTLKRSPKQVLRSFHWFLFQLPLLPELIIKLSRGGFLRYLWKLWSPNFSDTAHVDHIIPNMLKGHGIKHSLAYYRAALQKRYRDPELSDLYAQLDNPISTPTRVLCGAQDMRAEMLQRQADLFKAESRYNWHIVENAGHFLHREQADAVNALIQEWFTMKLENV